MSTNGHTNGQNGHNGINNHQNGLNGLNGNGIHEPNGTETKDRNGSYSPPSPPIQTPVAIVGLSCRLPGKSNSPEELWKFLLGGGVADATPPSHRYNISTHWDGSQRPGTMPSPGGMLLKDVDLTAFDASFFKIGHAEAAVMDPQQRQLLEVTYECLENSGTPLDKLRQTRAGCIVANNACEYENIVIYDHQDIASGRSTGFSRSILSNRISHFLDIQGPSITVDTACSGSMVGIDMACRYLQCNQADSMLVGSALLYLDPAALQDSGPMKGAFSPTGTCKTFDADADGYIRAEAVSCMYLKRLDDAIRDGDPIRAVIRGSATNSDGNTTSLTQPSSEAQAAAIRMAYQNAGITNLNETGYLECHGTGTPTGDPIEVAGLASVFAPTRLADKPLIIGSIKSNIGHSESAAGLSGLIKTVLAVESGVIPGTPTFIKPSPRIDFDKSRVRATRRTIKWPKSTSGLRRASVNSFGFGGTNAHVVIEARDSMVKSRKGFVFSSHGAHQLGGGEEDLLETNHERLKLLVFSANDKDSLQKNAQIISDHLVDPAVHAKLSDVAYTLSDRRTHHFYRGFITSDSAEIYTDSMIVGTKKAQPPRVAFIFTGQGAQWSQMGRDLIKSFPLARRTIESLDIALQTLADPPKWSLMAELTEERGVDALRLPEFSQPLATALQIALYTVLRHWGITATRVLGHSSGEIAAAVAAELVTPEEAIKIAYLRGLAAKSYQPEQPLGMLAVGLSPDAITPYLESEPAVQVACYNSSRSLTLAGQEPALKRICDRLQEDGHFGRLLQVNLAYHSEHIRSIADEYYDLLHKERLVPDGKRSGNDVTMFSSVTEQPISEDDGPLGPEYWRKNMVSPVRFAQTAAKVISGKDRSEILVEIGPTGALAGPIVQLIKDTPEARNAQYVAAAKRGAETLLALYEVAGKIWTNGGAVDLFKVNDYHDPDLVVDLPNYQWNHSKRYWRECLSGTEYLQRPFITHELLGSKILSVPWRSPTFYQVLNLNDLPWLRDHMIGNQVIFPAAGFLAMAVEAIHQTVSMTKWKEQGPPAAFAYRLKDVKILHSLVLEEDERTKTSLALSPVDGSLRPWFSFRVASFHEGSWIDHSTGLIRIDEDEFDITAPPRALESLVNPDPGSLGYKNANEGEFYFGPSFQRIKHYEWTWGGTETRAQVTTEDPTSAYSKQSQYPVHPVVMDSLIQMAGYAVVQIQTNALNEVNWVPVGIESIVIPARSKPLAQTCMVRAVAELPSSTSTSARPSSGQCSSAGLYDPDDQTLIMYVDRLRFNPISAPGHTRHAYMYFGWKADVSLTDAEGLNTYLAAGGKDGDDGVQRLLNALSHQTPDTAVLEVNLSEEATTSLWLDKSTKARNGYARYHGISRDAVALSRLQEVHKDAPRTTWELFDVTHASGAINSTDKFDLVVVRSSYSETDEAIRTALSNILPIMSKDAKIVLFRSHASGAEAVDDTTGKLLEDLNFTHILDLSPSLGGVTVLAGAPCETWGSTTPTNRSITYVRFTDSEKPIGVLEDLKARGWNLEASSAVEEIAPKSNVLVLDELLHDVATSFTDAQFTLLQNIIQKECNILWVTKGGQMAVTEPDRAVASGLLRTLRSEEIDLRLITLDVEQSTGPRTVQAVDQCLRLLLKRPLEAMARKDSEFAERGGVIYTPRLLADPALNEAKKEAVDGRKPQLQDIHEREAPVGLSVERVGTIDSLHYAEKSSSPLPIQDDHVEIEIHAAGINFSDLAITLGIVTTSDPFIGGECSGVISRVGRGVEKFVPGQRVVVMFMGSFSNKIMVPWQIVHAIPDSLSFNEAATLSVAYITAMYGLLDLANLKKGQRVLIHSATGGTGNAAVQICQYVGAELFVTAGSDEKRQFLHETFNIPTDHIFSSRTAEFEHKILHLTKGLGVDVILNSLTGELLEASWNIIAYGGTMVEMGKKDIIGHSRLSMEPFKRSASFRALDVMSFQVANPSSEGYIVSTLSRLFDQLFAFLEAGHVRPIFPMHVFPFGKVKDAFSLMRSTKHMGKLVLSRDLTGNDVVPIRPVPRALRFKPNATYVLVGGLKGICGSLAIDFAKKGARHLTTISRGSHDDEQSIQVLRHLQGLGCHVDLQRGDITNVEDVRRIFEEAKVPIAGIIQGAMVLRDRPFAKMTLQEYREATAVKIQGTWNLHNMALEYKAELDFFTCLSSISSVLGNAAQGNYAAGCSFQDAFASYRQGLGLPANTVNLGIIEQVGYMARNEELLEKNVSSEVAHGIDEKLLCKIITYSILQQSNDPVSRDPFSQVRMVTGLGMPQPSDSLLRLDARFAALFVREESESESGTGDTQDTSKQTKELSLMLRSKNTRLANMPQLVDATVSVVSSYLTRTLRLSDAIEPERSLSAYGIDSLAAVEFRNWLRLELGAALSVIEIATAQSLIILSEKIISKVDNSEIR